MTKKEPFFTSVSFFMRADSLTLERSRFPELFFQHLLGFLIDSPGGGDSRCAGGSENQIFRVGVSLGR